MSDWEGLTPRERRVLAETAKCQGSGTPGLLAGRLGLKSQQVAYDLGTLRMLRLVSRYKTAGLTVYETTPAGDEALAEGQTQRVEVRGDVL